MWGGFRALARPPRVPVCLFALEGGADGVVGADGEGRADVDVVGAAVLLPVVVSAVFDAAFDAFDAVGRGDGLFVVHGFTPPWLRFGMRALQRVPGFIFAKSRPIILFGAKV